MDVGRVSQWGLQFGLGANESGLDPLCKWRVEPFYKVFQSPIHCLLEGSRATILMYSSIISVVFADFSKSESTKKNNNLIWVGGFSTS